MEVGGARRYRIRQPSRGSERGRGPGDVRGGHDGHRGQPGRVPVAFEHRAQVGERGHRARDRLRHRAVRLQGEGGGRRAAMGRGARAVPAGARPLARGALHRPPERRHVPVLSGADPAADGPRVPRRPAQGREPEAPGGQRAARRARARVHAERDRDHRPRRAGAAARPHEQGASRARGGRGRDDLRERAGPGEDVRDAAPRTQGGDTGGRRRPAATRARGAAAERASRARPGGDARPEALLRRLRLRVVRELRGGAGGMNVNGVAIEDTFAEAFTMRVARIVITGRTAKWAREAAVKLTGFATSVIGCKCEAGIERGLADQETPDGRPGVSVLFLTMDKESLPQQLIVRLGQTVLTCPTTACFDGLQAAPDRLAVGRALRVFGDGFQGSKVIGGRRYWRVPVMEGEFLIEETFGMQKGVGGGNFLILAEHADAALAAAEAAVLAMTNRPGVILPFPGGVVRSGSKVGSKRYKNMLATTNEAFSPTLRAIAPSALPEGVNSVLEIVLDGTDAPSIEAAMRVGIRAACLGGVRSISAGNYGGKLGPHHFPLRKIMTASAVA